MMKISEFNLTSKLFLVLGYLSLVLCITQSASYDFLYFVQTWPGAYCYNPTECHSDIKADFGIHGLWPMKTDGTYPKDCDPSNPLDLKEIGGLVGFLQVKWPSLPKVIPSEQFWAYEWKTHGTCSVLEQYTYFQRSLRLKEKTKLLENLKKKGIEPNGKSYKKTEIESALKETFGFTPGIMCNSKGDLYEIYFCADTQGNGFTECKYFRTDTKCGKNIVFPAFQKQTENINLPKFSLPSLLEY